MSLHAPGTQPTFLSELEALADAQLALWLGTELPSGPVLLWGCDRHMAAVIGLEGRRPVVLLEPDEGAASEAVRSGAAGVRVIHTPFGPGSLPLADLGLRAFTSIVVAGDRLPSGPPDLVVQLLELADDPVTVCVAMSHDGPARVIDELQGWGFEPQVFEQWVTAGSCIGRAPGSGAGPAASVVRELGDPALRRVRRRLVVASAEPVTPLSILLGDDQGTSSWAVGIEQMTASVVHLDRLVGEEHAARISELELQLAESEARCASAELSISEWAAQVELIHRSTSWRLTRPLRGLKDLVARR